MSNENFNVPSKSKSKSRPSPVQYLSNVLSKYPILYIYIFLDIVQDITNSLSKSRPVPSKSRPSPSPSPIPTLPLRTHYTRRGPFRCIYWDFIFAHGGLGPIIYPFSCFTGL